MEFRLPETIAAHLKEYDEVERQVQRKAAKNTDAPLKRKSKLLFPCPDIFFDLSFEAIQGIYEFFCFQQSVNRFMNIEDETNYYVAWHKDTESKEEIWYCWKQGDKDCPITLRTWTSLYECGDYVEYRANESLEHLKRVKENPFKRRYKVDIKKADQFNFFIDKVEATLPASTSRSYSALNVFADTKFFYSVFFKDKSAEQYLRTYSMGGVIDNKIPAIAERIATSKFYQAELKTFAEDLRQQLIVHRRRPVIETFLRKIDLVYLFLFFYPDEYDRSIHLFNCLKELPSQTYWPSLYFLSDLKHEHNKDQFVEWFTTKISANTFSSWIQKQVSIMTADERGRYDTTFSDTMKMMYRVWSSKEYQIEKENKFYVDPKRWRLLEVHDHYTDLVLQLDNALTSLPVDLIPEPIEFQTDLGTITMFQPKTNHEVICWGKQVRNCVGSAGYDKRVLNKEAFLIFAMLDQKPWVTSLLTLHMGMLRVGQTVSPSNQSLSSDATALFNNCLKDALDRLQEQVDSRQMSSHCVTT